MVEELLVKLVQPLIMATFTAVVVVPNLQVALMAKMVEEQVQELAEMAEMEFHLCLCTNTVQAAEAAATGEAEVRAQECRPVVDLDMLAVLQLQLLLQEMHQCPVRPVEIRLADQGMATSELPMRHQ
jgi:hypothetical protein